MLRVSSIRSFQICAPVAVVGQELAESKRQEDAKWQLIETEQHALRMQREQMQVCP